MMMMMMIKRVEGMVGMNKIDMKKIGMMKIRNLFVAAMTLLDRHCSAHYRLYLCRLRHRPRCYLEGQMDLLPS